MPWGRHGCFAWLRGSLRRGFMNELNSCHWPGKPQCSQNPLRDPHSPTPLSTSVVQQRQEDGWMDG